MPIRLASARSISPELVRHLQIEATPLMTGGERPWFRGVQIFQRRGRAEPHQGQVGTLEEAKAAWRNCWDSADANQIATFDAAARFLLPLIVRVSARLT